MKLCQKTRKLLSDFEALGFSAKIRMRADRSEQSGNVPGCGYRAWVRGYDTKNARYHAPRSYFMFICALDVAAGSGEWGRSWGVQAGR